jgi:hypothetical protein
VSDEIEIDVEGRDGYYELRAPAKLWIAALYSALSKEQQALVREYILDRQ